jgi:hypothetical protein
MSQQNKTTLQSNINTQLPDNTSGDISAADIRDNLINITDSLLFNSGSQGITGSLTATSFTGSLQGTATTASYVVTAQTASYFSGTVISASYSTTSSYAVRAGAANKISTINIAGGGTYYPLLANNYFGDVSTYTIQSTDYRYDLSINQLIVSSISASFTGSLQGTSSHALTASYYNGPSALPYQVYTALLSYNGTFTVNQLQNTIGNGSNTNPNDIQWSTVFDEFLRATKTGAFTSSKVYINIPSMNLPTGPHFFIGAKSTFPGQIDNSIDISIIKYDNTTPSPVPNFTDLPIEIRIYS